MLPGLDLLALKDMLLGIKPRILYMLIVCATTCAILLALFIFYGYSHVLSLYVNIGLNSDILYEELLI